MTLWRLEWLRLVRTKRLAALIGIYVFFGFLGPPTARYLPEIIDRFGGDITVVVPDPVPVDGVSQYVANASQVALLVAIGVVAAATTLEALPQMSVFLRTRVRSGAHLVLPRAVVAGTAVIGAYLLGALVAWYETVVLLGPLPAGRMAAGIAFGALYLGFAVTVTAAAGAMLSGVLATAGVSILIMIAMPLVGIVEPIGSVLPSHLVGALVGLAGHASAAEYLPAAAVSVAGSALLLTFAVRKAGSHRL